MIISMSVGAARHRADLKLVQLMVLDAATVQAKETWEGEAVIISTPYLAAGAQQEAAGTTINMMVGARLGANELDVSLIPKDHVYWIAAQEAIVPLETVLTLPENADCICLLE